MKNGNARSWAAALLALSFLAMSPARATIIVVEPDDYAAGTDVTNLVDGVTLHSFTYDGVSADPSLEPLVIQYYDNCAGSGDPAWCWAVTGTNSFGVGGTTESFSLAEIAACFGEGSFCAGLPEEARYFNVLLAVFDTPTDFVEISGAWPFDQIDGYAFDASFNLISGINSNVINLQACQERGYGNCTNTLSIETLQPNITYFLAGSFAGAGAMDHLRFRTSSVPEPGTLALFGMALIGMGLSRRHRQK